MKIETLEVSGFYPALHGMRNPMDSWAKSDTTWHTTEEMYPDEPFHTTIDFLTGDADHDLSMRLQSAGPEHCKHLRMIMAYADITAPRYWWNEFDTYRAGVEKVSCSTMHKLMARPLTIDDFEHESIEIGVLEKVIDGINADMEQYKKAETGKLLIWRGIIQMLPQSYLQKRTVMMSYAALRNIYRQREGHKLREWKQFREWVETLPENWMIIE